MHCTALCAYVKPHGVKLVASAPRVGVSEVSHFNNYHVGKTWEWKRKEPGRDADQLHKILMTVHAYIRNAWYMYHGFIPLMESHVCLFFGKEKYAQKRSVIFSVILYALKKKTILGPDASSMKQ